MQSKLRIKTQPVGSLRDLFGEFVIGSSGITPLNRNLKERSGQPWDSSSI